MKRFFLAAILTLSAGSFAFAGELDNESSVTNQSMNGTVVIRVDTRNSQTSVLTTAKPVVNDSQAQSLIEHSEFQNVDSNNVKSELDHDGGASSWYFYNGYNNHYSYMYWYGSWYTPCYSYSYGYYQYYYYSNHWW